MSEVTVSDLIGAAAEQSPEAFKHTFNQLMQDKILDALDAKKQEVAASYFNSAEADTSVEQELETQENEDQDGQNTQTDS